MGGCGGVHSCETQKQNSNIPSAMSRFASLEDIQNNVTMVLKKRFGKRFPAIFPGMAEILENMYEVKR
jgi:hypothetical protein